MSMALTGAYCCAVQGKISCVYETNICDQGSTKRPHQPFKVVATETLVEEARPVIATAVATEKLDGTSCCVRLFQGKPWLWVRRDRRPTKAAEKQFRKFLAASQSPTRKTDEKKTFSWDIKQHFKDIPEHWIPADRVALDESGEPLPTDSGHIPGWIPADPTSRNQCWHLTAVDLQHSLALTLCSPGEDETRLVICPVPLADLLGCTLELIGTNVNGNPYGLGSKICPIHLLVQHGIIRSNIPSPTDFGALRSWFAEGENGQVEGVVWHCCDGSLFKVHRHHLNLPWPVSNPSFSSHCVQLKTSLLQWDIDADPLSLLGQLSLLDQVQCASFSDLNARLAPEPLPDK